MNKVKQLVEAILTEIKTLQYGGKGNFELPDNHLAAMKVPKGGSSCLSCKFWNKEESICVNSFYQNWAQTNTIPVPPNEYCSDWYEPSPKLV